MKNTLIIFNIEYTDSSTPSKSKNKHFPHFTYTEQFTQNDSNPNAEYHIQPPSQATRNTHLTNSKTYSPLHQ